MTDKPITTAVREAIEAQLDALRRRRPAAASTELDGIISRGRARRTLDDRTEDEILGYDADGLPS